MTGLIALVIAVITYSHYRSWQSMLAFVAVYVVVFGILNFLIHSPPSDQMGIAIAMLPIFGAITAAIAVGFVWLKDRYGN